MFVPVVDSQQQPLMPTTPARARRWIESSKATPFWKRGVFCVRLNVNPSAQNVQEIAVGIDPGSKKEGFTVKSNAHTYLNIQADAVTWVSRAVETRRNMRRARRFRKTPYRANRMNRKRGGLPPSTKARWQWKLRILRWLCKMFPVKCFAVEDIQAKTLKNGRKWNANFSPLQVGKNWFYGELENLGRVFKYQGYETKTFRDIKGLKKTSQKMAEVFAAHCVDSWVLASDIVGDQGYVDNTDLLLITPLQFHRRQLHVMRPADGGIRKHYGGTRSLGLTRGSLVRHVKRGVCYVGGCTDSRISLHSMSTGKRLCRNAKPSDCKFLAYNSWRLSNE
jgi:hypothetical protein